MDGDNNKGGRGRKTPINLKQLEALAEINCTEREMAQVLGISQSSLSKRYRNLIDQIRLRGKCSLRRWQWKKAEEGNTTMLIWLGKNELGQSDTPQNEVNVTVNNDAGQSPLDEFLRRKQAESPGFIENLLERSGLQNKTD